MRAGGEKVKIFSRRKFLAIQYCEIKDKNNDMCVPTSGAIQGKVPTRERRVVCWWNLEDPKSQIFAVRSAAITTGTK